MRNNNNFEEMLENMAIAELLERLGRHVCEEDNEGGDCCCERGCGCGCECRCQEGDGRYNESVSSGRNVKRREVKVERVIFNDPATIVFWDDGVKTVVKCQKGDKYNKELGLALCIIKRYCGNTGRYNNFFKKWIPETEEAKRDWVC